MKAVSVIFLAVLVVLIAIALTALGYIFFYRVFTGTATTEWTGIGNSMSNMGLGLQIDAAGGNNVYIRNTGTSDLKNFLVYVNGVPVSYSINTPVLHPQEVATITINDPMPGSDVSISVTGPGVKAYFRAHNMAFFGGFCDVNITQPMTPYTITESNKLYCLAENVYTNGQTAITFSLGVQNSTLECLGYNIDSNNVANTYGVYLTGASTKNNTIKNCYITDFYKGIYLQNGPSNNILNNIVYNNSYSLHIDSSSNNIITNNTFTKFYNEGALIYNSNNNTITGGSINNNCFDYYISSAGTTNNFTSTNFTQRSIFFDDTTSWFNYNNDTTGNIWLKTSVSNQWYSITRKLLNWNQSLIRWSDTFSNTSGSITARYNITGLLSNTNYNVYNNSVLITGSPFTSDVNGQISFTINLPGNQEREIKVNTSAFCDFYIYQSNMINTYSITQSNKLYCLAQNIYIGGQIAIAFSSGVQNTILDCQGYNIDSNDTLNTWGVYLSGNNYNIMKNCNITDFDKGIYLVSSDNNNLTNNIFISNAYHSIYLWNSNYSFISNNNCTLTASDSIALYDSFNNIVSNNNISNAGEDGIFITGSSMYNLASNNYITTCTLHGLCIPASYNNFSNNYVSNSGIGINLWASSNYNIFDNTNAINNNLGAHIRGNNNIIRGGSIVGSTSYDYYVESAGFTNNVTNTNFTSARKIYFTDSASWFNYNNETTGNIWLKTNVSAATTITRKLVSWSQSLIQWNDTSSADCTVANYNITGLTTNTYYNVYDNSFLFYTIDSSSSGQINFTIYLAANQEHEIKVQKSTTFDGVLWFKFNEGSGTKVYDFSPFNNNGIFYGENFNVGTFINMGSSSRTCGHFGKALKFRGLGVNDSVSVPDSSSLQIRTFTITAWIKPSKTAANPDEEEPIFDHQIWASCPPSPISCGYGYTLSINFSTAGNKLVLLNGDGTNTSYIKAYSSPLIQTDTWQHIAVSYDSSNVSRFYINGALAGSGTIPFPVHTSWGGDKPKIGTFYYPTDNYFNGTIDELRIYNRSLSQAEIQADMQSPKPIERTAASWSFEEPNTASYVNDTHIWVKGTYGSALSFDGIDDYVNVSNSASLNPKNITLGAWIKPTPKGDCELIINKWADYYDLYIDGSGYLTFAFRNASVPGTIHWATSNLQASWNVWQYVAATYNGTHTVFYLNGTNNSVSSNYGDIGASDPYPVCIGCDSYYLVNPGDAYYFKGIIDEVRIWNRTLSQAEIQAEMNSG